MGMKKVYTCNICQNTKEESDVAGFWFGTNETEPKLISPEHTNNIHICDKCRFQLSVALTKEAIDYTS